MPARDRRGRRYLDDGDVASVAPGCWPPSAPPMSPPPRFCTAIVAPPLALWTFDDCNTHSTELADSATSIPSGSRHPAFRPLSVACVAGRDGEAVRSRQDDDVVYAPDQPDFLFNQGSPSRLDQPRPPRRDADPGAQAPRRHQLVPAGARRQQLIFILKLTSGRVVAVAAPVQAGRFTHVAATYDGTAGGALSRRRGGRARQGAGTIAPGRGPDLPRQRRRRTPLHRHARQRLAQHAGRARRRGSRGSLAFARAPVVSLSPADEPPEPAGTAGGVRPGDHQRQRSDSCPGRDVPVLRHPSVRPHRRRALRTFFAGDRRDRAPGDQRHRADGVRLGPYPFTYIVFDTTQLRRLAATASATLRRLAARPRHRRPDARPRRPSRSRRAATTSTATRSARRTGAPTCFTASIAPRWSGPTSARTSRAPTSR